MSALTNNRKTRERYPSLRQFEAGAAIYAGALAAVNAAGKLVPASDASGLTVLGRAEGAAAPGAMAAVKSGCFCYQSVTGANAVTAKSAGKVCYVSDDQTVTLAAGNHSVVAGTVYDVDEHGVWVVTGAAAPRAGDYAAADHDHDEDYLALPTAAAAIADVAAPGENSADLITALNAALAVLRSNGFIAAE